MPATVIFPINIEPVATCERGSTSLPTASMLPATSWPSTPAVLTETELSEIFAHAVDAHLGRERIEIGVDRLRECLHQVDPAMATAPPVTIGARLPRQKIFAGGQHRGFSSAQSQFQSAQAKKRFDR